MILGVGTDIVNINRIKESISQFGDSFINRCFTPKEIEIANTKAKKVEFYAKRFAAKEAFLKALGTGMTHKVSWQDLEIVNNVAGRPLINVKGESLEIMNRSSLEILNKSAKDINIHLTMSDDDPYATATVIIEVI